MTTVTTEVSYDTAGIARRIERKRTKSDLAWRVANMRDLLYSDDVDPKGKVEAVRRMMDDLLW